jgi:predicted DNA-binding protein YlxM (UPF0122 family)
MGHEIKRGDEILSEYFKTLEKNEEISQELREKLHDLWSQNQLKTKTHINNALAAMRSGKIDE